MQLTEYFYHCYGTYEHVRRIGALPEGEKAIVQPDDKIVATPGRRGSSPPEDDAEARQ